MSLAACECVYGMGYGRVGGWHHPISVARVAEREREREREAEPSNRSLTSLG